MKFLYSLIFSCISLAAFAQVNLNVELLSSVSYDSAGNDVWGYAAPDGSEYALFGTRNGVSVVNVTDPTNPVEVDFIEQQGSTWRDMKTWGEYAYVVADQGGTTDGLLIIDMRDLPNSISWENVNPEVEGNTINRCHNIYIDEFGYAYLAGCNVNRGGIVIFDVFSNPGEAELISLMPDTYSHDVYVRENIVYSSEINEGEFAAYGVEDKQNISELGRQSTPFNFTHNTWLSDDGNILFTTDERANAPVAAYDVSDLSNITYLDEFRPKTTIGSNVIPHNVHVWDDYLIVSYYTDGCILVDASRPENLIEVGNFDTYIPANAGFNGAWGAYPFLPSGIILVGDINNGLFILGPTYVRASFLEGTVLDRDSGLPINNAIVSIDELLLTEQTTPTGEYKTGTAIEGMYSITATAFGYEPQTFTDIALSSGIVTMVDFELEPSPTVNLTVNLIEKSTGNPVPEGKIILTRDEEEFEITTDVNGVANLPSLFAGNYGLVAGAWGYKYNILDEQEFSEVDLNPSITIELEEGYEDIFSLDLGWEESFSGFQGAWERGVPQGASPDGTIFIAPPFDSESDPLNHAFATGNTSDFQGGVLFGEAVLRSPMMDLSSFANPALSYDYWYWATDFAGTPADNTLNVFVTNGTDQVLIDQISFETFGIIDWESRSPIELASLVEITENMQLVIQASLPGMPNIAMDVSFDNFLVQDLPPSSTEDVITDLNILSYPNPFTDEITISIPLDFQTENSVIEVYDTQGKLMQKQSVANTNTIEIGSQLNAGVYMFSLRSTKQLTKPIKIIKM